MAVEAAAKLGREIRHSRGRRRLRQQALADRVGISRALLAKIEAGQATGTSSEVWFALAVALDRFLRVELGRDRLHELTDAGHADLQELVLRLSRPAGYRGGFELRTRAIDLSRSIDVARAPLPAHPGLVWSDVRATRLFGHRRRATRLFGRGRRPA